MVSHCCVVQLDNAAPGIPHCAFEPIRTSDSLAIWLDNARAYSIRKRSVCSPSVPKRRGGFGLTNDREIRDRWRKRRCAISFAALNCRDPA